MTLHFERAGFDDLVVALNAASRRLDGETAPDASERRATGTGDPNVN
jgi:hypothetical protein